MATPLERLREVLAALPEGAVAVEEGPRAVTFAALAARAHHLAGPLATLGGAAPLALVAPPGAGALAAILGALEAGRIVAAVEPRGPILRQLDAGAALVADAHAARALAACGFTGAVASLADLDGGAPARAPSASGAPAARREPDASDLAMVCFSSGSSGRPKGVALTHGSIAAGAAGYRAALDLVPGDRVAWLAPLPFGASLTVAFGALLAGATLVPGDVSLGIPALVSWLDQARVTVLHVVPSLFRRIAEAVAARPREGRALAALRVVKVGGEASFASDLALFRRTFPTGVALVNGLGLTEATGNVCYARFEGGPGPAGAASQDPDGPRLPVGAPTLDTAIALLDDAQAEVADGAPGRIAVAGPSLAAGYWRDPDATARAFRDLPGHTGRWLVTQDVGRRDARGRLEHLGRADDVVKLRGQSVATGEVEAALAGLPGVEAAAVLAVPHPVLPGEATLAAFVVGAAGAPTAAALAAVLPEAMVPARVLAVAELPRLPSGKVDRQALLARLAERRPPDDRIVAPAAPPRDTLALQLRAAFERALGVDGVGPDEDFFALGGHSLAAVEVLAFVARHLGVDLPMTALHEHPTARALARAIRTRSPGAAAAPAVLLRAGRPDERPIFAIGGKGVEVLALRDLARSLAPVPVYGLQYAALRGGSLRLVSLAAMAEDLLGGVLAVQPRGPYRLLGASFGGRVVFELARLLRARGEEVELLALLDAYGPGYLRWRPSRDLGASLYALRCAIAPWTRQARRNTLGAFLNAVRSRLRRELARVELALGRRAPPTPAQRHVYALAVAAHAGRVTRHAPLDVRIDLFRSAEQPPRELARPLGDLGWGGLAGRGLVVHDIPGVHGDYLREPVASEVARRVHALLGVMSAGS